MKYIAQTLREERNILRVKRALRVAMACQRRFASALSAAVKQVRAEAMMQMSPKCIESIAMKTCLLSKSMKIYQNHLMFFIFFLYEKVIILYACRRSLRHVFPVRLLRCLLQAATGPCWKSK